MGEIKGEKRKEAGGETWRTVQRSSRGARAKGETGRGSCFPCAAMGAKQRWVHQIFIRASVHSLGAHY